MNRNWQLAFLLVLLIAATGLSGCGLFRKKDSYDRNVPLGPEDRWEEADFGDAYLGSDASEDPIAANERRRRVLSNDRGRGDDEEETGEQGWFRNLLGIGGTTGKATGLDSRARSIERNLGYD